MAHLYELKAELLKAYEEAFDEETGEILDRERIDNAVDNFNEKVENTLLYIKNLKADAKAIKEEKMNLANRQKVLENKAEWFTNYLANILEGAEFECARGKVSYRASQIVDINMEEFMKNDNAEEYLKYKDPEPDKEAIKKALKGGATFTGATLVDKSNIQIK